MKSNAEQCVCCGATIPEGRQICPGCEEAASVKFKRAGVFIECQSCERGTDNGGYCLDCYFGNKYTELKEMAGDTDV